MLRRGQRHAPCVSALLAESEQAVVQVGTLWASHLRDPDSGHLVKGLGRDEKEESKVSAKEMTQPRTTVPPKGKLPSSRETRLFSLETRLVSLETSLVSLECTVSTVQRLRVLVYSSYCVCTHWMKACFGGSYRRLSCSVGAENGRTTFIHE